MKMPGEVEVEGPWSPEGEAMTQAIEAREPAPYKPGMGKSLLPPKPVDDPNPFAKFVNQGFPAQQVEVAKPGWKERAIEHWKNAQRYGLAGIVDLGEIRDAEMGFIKGVAVGEEEGKAYAEQLRQRRLEDQFQFDNMAPAETTMDYLAAIGGGLAGAVVDPLSLLGPEVKLGTAAWRLGFPVVSRMLESGASNAAMNVLLNATVQGEEGRAGLRDQIDWKSLALDAGAGFSFGVPFGFINARSYAKQVEAERQAAPFAEAPEPGKATWAPRAKPVDEGPSTPETVQQEHTPEEFNQAQIDLYGEVVGTRNLTFDQLSQLDDYLNAKKPGDIPQAPIETEGSALTNDAQDVPAVPDTAQPQDQPVREVPEPGRQESPPEVQGPPVREIGGVEVRFPDREHENLYAVGKDIEAGKIDLKAAQGILKTFKGWVHEGPDAPFNNAKDAGEFARDYAQRIDEESAKGKPFEAWDELASDEARAEWFKRQRASTTLKSAQTPLPLTRQYQEFDPSELKVDAKRFQFKEGGDDAGVTDRLKGVKRWDQSKSGVTLVWQSKDGTYYIADGHQRHGLATRLKAEGQNPKIMAYVLREKDGISSDDARAIAAAKNIAEGTGNAVDAAKILRSRPDMAVDLPPTSALVRDAQGLADLSDAAFGMVINKKVPAGYAAIVGRLAKDKETHAELLGMLAKEEPASAMEAESMVRDALDAPAVQATMEDMFGSAQVTQILFKERAQVLSSAAAALRKDRAAFNTLVKEEARLTGAGNKLATESNLERANSDAEIIATLQATARRKGPVADALAKAAQRLHEGEPRATVVRDFINDVRAAGSPTGKNRSGAGAPGREGEGIAARVESPEAGIAFSRRLRDEGPDLFSVERGADNKPQMVLPGAERISDKRLAELRASAPMRSGRAQKDMDIGLFGSGVDQLDLVDLSRMPKSMRQQSSAINMKPSAEVKSAKIGATVIKYSARDGEVEIHSVRTPIRERRQGAAREALLAFLEKADDEGLKVRAYSTPLDRLTEREGVIRMFERLGFTSTGRKINRAGDVEMLRSGPPVEIAELRRLVGSGRLIPLRDYTDPVLAEQVKSAFYGTQPARLIEEIYASGSLERNQKRLADFAKEIEQELGIEFKNPGVKKQADAQEKMTRKGYKTTKQLTDLVRGGFRVDLPDQAERAVQMLATKFRTLDEGWAITPVNYFDRKASVQFPDGTIGEVQFWHPDLIDAKDRVGHDLYEEWRVLPKGDPQKDILFQAQIDLYTPIVESLDPSWWATVGREGNVPNSPENVSLKSSSSLSSRPESATSAGSTSDQSSPGARTAQANEPPDMTAGRDSQSTNLSSGITPSSGVAFKRRPQPPNGVPVNRAQGGVSSQATVKAERLEDISADLSTLTGSPTRQGRLRRSQGGKVMGQFDRDQGVIRLREMSDFETQAHETAHALEGEWGRSLNTIKVQNRAEVEALAYAGAKDKEKLTEGFAEWFRYYLSAPQFARKKAPQFTAAFETMLRERAPDQLAKIQDLQRRYVAWQQTPSRAAVSADIVSQRRKGMVSNAVTEMRQEGVAAAVGRYADQIYSALIDKLHPINTSVDELLKVYEKNTGRALDIKSAQDPYRLARLLADAYSAGHIDAMHGIVPYQGVRSEGPSLSDAITHALGKKFTGWDDDLMADFAAYLVSRRALQEYDRLARGEIGNPPTKFTRGDHEVTIMELEAAHPEWVQAAQMVYEWQQNLLRKKYEAGFITQKVYEELMLRKDYVPFQRDLTDLDKETTAAANKTLRQSILKAFRGSKRSVINPLESMMADAYHFNALMKRNDVFKALDDLAHMAGPGSGQIVERIPSSQLNPSQVNVEDVLKAAAKEAGLAPDDVDQLTNVVGDMLGEVESATIFKAGDINEKGEPIIYVWRNGKKQALRLADGDFGRELYASLTGMNKEARNIFVSALALPTTIVRYGVTTAPHFVLANYIRDQMSAWVLAGDGYIPFVSGLKGLRDELTQNETSRIYNTVGGIMGGGNVASLDKGRAKRDISALNKKGYHVKRFANVRGFAEFTGLTETGTRLGVFSTAFKRARKEGLTEFEAAIEAAYQARDYIDFGRHGSQTHTARRLVTFLNASIQGLDKTFRVLSGEGSIRKAIAPYIAHRTGRPLSARDRKNIGKAAMAWAKVTAIGMFGLGLSYLYRDDPEYEEISDYLRATHWMVKKGPGEWYAIPKPFELGFVSNLFERSFDSIYGRNPIALQSFISGLYEVTAPPMGIPLFETMYELKHNKDALGRDIVGQDIAGFEPWRQYTAQTSEIAKQLGAAVNVSPAMIDHAIQGFGASWGKIVIDASRDRAAEKGYVETVTNSMTNRFVRDVWRGATSTRQFWDLMSESVGPFTQASNTYKDLFENGATVEADRLLETKDENTKAYTLLTAHFPAKYDRLHPMVRAKDAISAISKLRKEIAANDVTMVEDEETKITLTPSQRQMAQDVLDRLTMYEARNALVTIGQPGWAQKELLDSQSLRDQLRLALPDLADELDARYEKKKVYDEVAIREVWPEVKARILEDRQDANFDDILPAVR